MRPEFPTVASVFETAANLPLMRANIAWTLELLAICLLGLMSGFFFAFAVDVAPAMAQLDAATYITVQQSINRVVRGAVFGVVYFGSTILPFAAALAAFWTGRRAYAGFWLLIALAYFLAVFWLTRSVNVPINTELATWSALAPPDTWRQARDAWNESNLIRTVAATICFACSVALAISSRFRASGTSVG